MFSECNLLEELLLFEEDKTVKKQVDGIKDKNNSDSDSKLSEKFYYKCNDILIKNNNNKEIRNNKNDFNKIITISGIPHLNNILPDRIKWDTSICMDLSNMFNGCKSLMSLPDLSKWNTNNVTNISGIFKGCSSLISLPDISKWNINKVTNISGIFEGCSHYLFYLIYQNGILIKLII